MANYLEVLQGKFFGIMDWEKCHNFFDFLMDSPNAWYIYDLDLTPPNKSLSASEFCQQITIIKQIIDNLHEERYCGIVYTDDLEIPELIKIFHPHNLGKTCGSSENPPLPRWIISKIKPVEIKQAVEKKSGLFSFLR
jgi:hypothetical protein